jgi:hypothetical protein
MTRHLTLALSLAALLAGSAPAAPPQKKAPGTPTAVPAPNAEVPPIFDPDADGDKTLAHYGSVCEQSNRRLFLTFGTNDCKPCRVVNKAIYDPKFLTQFLRQFVPAFIDVTPGSTNAAIPARYGIDSAAALPGIVLFTPKGSAVEVLKSGEMAAIASKGPEAVQLWIIDRFERSRED